MRACFFCSLPGLVVLLLLLLLLLLLRLRPWNQPLLGPFAP